MPRKINKPYYSLFRKKWTVSTYLLCKIKYTHSQKKWMSLVIYINQDEMRSLKLIWVISFEYFKYCKAVKELSSCEIRTGKNGTSMFIGERESERVYVSITSKRIVINIQYSKSWRWVSTRQCLWPITLGIRFQVYVYMKKTPVACSLCEAQ